MKLNDLSAGDTVYPDGGFTCIEANKPCVVAENARGKFIGCDEGRHYLDGQENEDGALSGLSGSPWPVDLLS